MNGNMQFSPSISTLETPDRPQSTLFEYLPSPLHRSNYNGSFNYSRHLDIFCYLRLEKVRLMGVHKAKKIFSLRGPTANSERCGQKINNQTYPDLVYDVVQRPQRDIDNQNSHSCDN